MIMSPRDHTPRRGLHGTGDAGGAGVPARRGPGGGGLYPGRRLLLPQEGHGEHRGRPGHPALLLRGAGLLEPADAHQPELPLHQPPPHRDLGCGRLRALLRSLPPQVSARMEKSNDL